MGEGRAEVYPETPCTGFLTPVNGCILQRMMTVLLMVISVLLNDPQRKKEDMTEPHVIVVSNRDTRAALRAV